MVNVLLVDSEVRKHSFEASTTKNGGSTHFVKQVPKTQKLDDDRRESDTGHSPLFPAQIEKHLFSSDFPPWDPETTKEKQGVEDKVEKKSDNEGIPKAFGVSLGIEY